MRKGNKDLKQAQYSASKAQEKAQNRQKESHKKFVLKSYVIREEVERLIMKNWSPELISGRLKKKGIGEIRAESIYKWIFKEKQYLIPYLRRYNKDRVYKKRGSYKIKVREKIKQVFSYPRCPKINAYIERFNRTLREEFIDVNGVLIKEDEEFKNLLIDWLVYYNSKRPHFSLNLKSPLQFMVEKYKMSHMYLTNT